MGGPWAIFARPTLADERTKFRALAVARVAPAGAHKASHAECDQGFADVFRRGRRKCGGRRRGSGGDAEGKRFGGCGRR